MFARQHGFERSTNRNLSFAEANVAANQAIHWQWLFHVLLCGVNRAKLVRCFLVGKGIFKRLLPVVVGWKGVARRVAPLRVQIEKLRGVVQRGNLCGGARFFPERATDLAEFRSALGEANVAGE